MNRLIYFSLFRAKLDIIKVLRKNKIPPKKTHLHKFNFIQLYYTGYVN